MSQRVLVIGAGIVGLTCAVRLAEAGYDTHVLAADLPPETTSAAAGALWMPHLTASWDVVAPWARITLETYRADSHTDVGVSWRRGLLLTADGRNAVASPPEWTALLAGSAQLPATAHTARAPHPPAPPAQRSDGMGPWDGAWAITLPVIHPLTYLRALGARLSEAGGTITRMNLSALPAHGIVINATGFRARYLVGDSAVRPMRGQTVLVRNPGMQGWWCADQGVHPRYVIARGEHCLLGGTHELDTVDPTPDPRAGQDILADIAAIDSRFVGIQPLRMRAGIRPARELPRVEVERDDERLVVHCYGHGGAGWTLAWGTAADVVALVEHAA